MLIKSLLLLHSIQKRQYYLDVEADYCIIDESIKTKKAMDPVDVVNNCSMYGDIEPEEAVLILGTTPEGEDEVEDETTKQEREL